MSPFCISSFQAPGVFLTQHRGALPPAGLLRLALPAAVPLCPSPLPSADADRQLGPAPPAPAHAAAPLPRRPGPGGGGFPLSVARRRWPPCAAPALLLRGPAERVAGAGLGAVRPAGAGAGWRHGRVPPAARPGRGSTQLWGALAGAAGLRGLTTSVAQTALLAALALALGSPARWIASSASCPRSSSGLWRRRLPRRERALDDRRRVLLRLVPSAAILDSSGAVARAVWGMRSSGDQRQAVDTRGSPPDSRLPVLVSPRCLPPGVSQIDKTLPHRRPHPGKGATVSDIGKSSQPNAHLVR